MKTTRLKQAITKCRFCDNRAEHRCGWPLPDRLVNLLPAEVKRGMQVGASQHSGSGKRIYPEVVLVEELPLSYTLPSAVALARFSITLSWFGKEYVLMRAADEPMDVLQPGPCGVPICFAHEREVSDSRHYCADHWNAWDDSQPASSHVDFSKQRAIDSQLVRR